MVLHRNVATDANTQLSESEVETYITNGSIGLASVLQWVALLSLRLPQTKHTTLWSQVETFITNGSINLATSSKVNGSNIVTVATDQNTQLSESQVETFVTNGSIGLASGSTMGGSTIVTTATDSDTLGGLNCSTDEIAKWNGSAWACAADDAGSGGSGGGLSIPPCINARLLHPPHHLLSVMMPTIFYCMVAVIVLRRCFWSSCRSGNRQYHSIGLEVPALAMSVSQHTQICLTQ